MQKRCHFRMLWSINPSFPGLFSTWRQVTYVLLTRSPVVSGASTLLPLDLHVLSLPLAFILSQYQTLRCRKRFESEDSSIVSCGFHHTTGQVVSSQDFKELVESLARRPGDFRRNGRQS